MSLNPKGATGGVLVVIGIVMIAIFAYMMIGIISHDVDDIRDLFSNTSWMILLGIVFGIPIIACIMPGYGLVKSAKENY